MLQALKRIAAVVITALLITGIIVSGMIAYDKYKHSSKVDAAKYYENKAKDHETKPSDKVHKKQEAQNTPQTQDTQAYYSQPQQIQPVYQAPTPQPKAKPEPKEESKQESKPAEQPQPKAEPKPEPQKPAPQAEQPKTQAPQPEKAASQPQGNQKAQ